MKKLYNIHILLITLAVGMAVATGRKLKWDAAKQEIIGDAEVSAMMQPKLRGPWKI